MDSQTYANFICSLGTIKWSVAFWSNDRSAIQNIPNIPGTTQSAVSLIRDALQKCNDEAPSPSPSELAFMPDADLRTSLQTDIAAVSVALPNGEWKAATVLAGSTIEALLLWDLQKRHSADVQPALTALVAGRVLKKQLPLDLEDRQWGLHEYIEVSAKIPTIKEETAQQARLAKDFRNLIHPARSQRLGQKCDRGTALASVAALDHVVRDLSC